MTGQRADGKGLKKKGQGLKSTCAIATVVLLSAAPLARQEPDRFAEWLTAIEAHEPGNPGKAAIDVSRWSGVELEAVVAEARRHVRSFDKGRRNEANELLLKGAALHADIARLIPDDMERRSAKQHRVIIVRDGRELGARFISIHWDLGRSLLDAIAPDPGAHPGVLLWYQHTSTDLLRIRSLAEAAVHLPRGRRIFPSDPVLLFTSGVLHERFSSTSLQAAAASFVANNRGETTLGSEKGELVRAERFFRDTLAIQPDHLEALVRHGHVLGALGRHKQAADALRTAIKGGVTGELLYFAEMFLGSQEMALGNSAQARDRFEHAASLYPRAQSPRIALSQLSRRAGDRSRAQRELGVIAALPSDERQREDPWWAYYDAQ